MSQLYQEGHGVPKDLKQSLDWLSKAAGHGNISAEMELGRMSEVGENVPKDEGRAVYWWRKAAEQGFRGAADRLTLFYGVSRNFTEARLWCYKGSHPEVCEFNLRALGEPQLPQQQSSTSDENVQAIGVDQPEEPDVQQEDDRQRRIEDLRSDIEEQEHEAERWDSSASNVGDNSSCTGTGAALCQGIGSLGAAKARQNAAKARQNIQEDREEIARLQNMPVPHVHIDTSYASALQQEQQQRPTPTMQDTLVQQQSKLYVIGAANGAARRQAAQQQTAPAQNTSQQPSNNGSQSGGHYATPVNTSCLGAYYDANHYGWLTFNNTCSQKIFLVIVLNDGADSINTNIGPGETGDWTHDSASMQRHGGYAMYSCPYPFNVVDSDNRPVQTRVTGYKCWKL